MADTTELLSIDTPENVSFEYDVAGIGSRFLAALVDTVLSTLLQVIAYGALVLILERTGRLFEDSAQAYWLVAIFSLIAFVLFWGYYIFFEILWNGQTPGKRWVGLRVIRVDGTPARATEIVIRNLVRTIDLLPAAYALGVVTMFINSKSRRLGDLAAGTLVVHDSRVTRLEDLRSDRRNALSTLTTTSAVPAGFPIERLTRREVELIEDFLMRRHQLANRDQLAAHILKGLEERLGHAVTPADGESAEGILIAIVKDLRQRSEA